MDQRHDLELILRSRTPIVVIETTDEKRILELIKSINLSAVGEAYTPLFRWTVTDGLQRLDIDLEPQAMNSEPVDLLKHVRAVKKPGIYVLLDFHPYMEDPVNVRLLKDICVQGATLGRQIILISHAIRLPAELESFAARVDLKLPSGDERRQIVERVADEWSQRNAGARVRADSRAYDLLIENLSGLTYADTERLARNAIYVDGAITKSDLPEVMRAKYELLNRGGALSFEYDTAKFSDIGGLERLKGWLRHRRAPFRREPGAVHLDPPRGILLIGVQGCGKSLAAKATAGIFGVPLLRLDFGSVYNKYHGETERRLRESLETADVMSPCVLWIDEIEKGLAGRGGETGTTQRVLGTFLTWLAEKRTSVFVVATANEINELPPELVRKGRFDEIFFVDLPDPGVRASIFAIHLTGRDQELKRFDLEALAEASDGFSGAEIEQAIVSSLYAAHAQRQQLDTTTLLRELRATKPLSIVMHERIDALRNWAQTRTVPAD